MISCSLYNSWYNLKEREEIGFVDNSITTTKIIPPGNYSLQSIGKRCRNYLKENTSQSNLMMQKVQLSSKIHSRKIIFDRDLTFLLGLNGNMKEISRTQLKRQAFINRWPQLTIILSTAISWIKKKISSMENPPRSLPVLASMENHSKEWNIHQQTLR